jgi:hypothetical protein
MIYSEFEILDVIKNVTEFIDTTDNMGLFCSGGFDSTTLLYVVFKHIHDVKSDKKINIYTVPRSDDSVTHAKRIVSIISKIFQNVRYTHKILSSNDVPHNIIVYKGMVEVSKNTNDWIVISDTKNPECLPNGPGRKKSSLPMQYHPLLSYYKTMTLQLADHYGVLSLISEISHTCTESKTLRCSKCWQCQERNWAFKQLNIEDTKID